MATKHYDGWQPDVSKRTRTYSGTHGTHWLQDFHYVMECFLLPGPPGSLPDKHFSHSDDGSLTAFLPGRLGHVRHYRTRTFSPSRRLLFRWHKNRPQPGPPCSLAEKHVFPFRRWLPHRLPPLPPLSRAPLPYPEPTDPPTPPHRRLTRRSRRGTPSYTLCLRGPFLYCRCMVC